MTKPKIVYFDGRGLGEASRLILRYAKVDFEDVRITQAEWPALKPSKLLIILRGIGNVILIFRN